jgi:hypothetical protein
MLPLLLKKLGVSATVYPSKTRRCPKCDLSFPEKNKTKGTLKNPLIALSEAERGMSMMLAALLGNLAIPPPLSFSVG